MVVGSNPTFSNAILGLKSCFLYPKTQKGLFICPKLMPEAKKFKKQKINSVPLRTTVLASQTVRLGQTQINTLLVFTTSNINLIKEISIQWHHLKRKGLQKMLILDNFLGVNGVTRRKKEVKINKY